MLGQHFEPFVIECARPQRGTLLQSLIARDNQGAHFRRIEISEGHYPRVDGGIPGVELKLLQQPLRRLD